MNAGAKKKRRAARREALETIAALPDESLRNLRYELGRELAQKCNVANEVRIRLDAVKSEIERRATATSAGVHVSDHAVLRYLERVRGVDMQEVREEIVAMAKRAGKLGSGNQYDTGTDQETGLTLGVNGAANIVTTVFDEREGRVMSQP